MTKNYNQLKQRKSTKEYLKIPFQNRRQLIRLVEQEKISIKKASERVNINYSTGKLIMKKFKDCGKITMFSYEKPESEQKSSLSRMNTSQNNQKIESSVQREQEIISDSNLNDIAWGWTWINLNPLNYPQEFPTYIFPLWGQNQTFTNQQIYSINFA